MRWIHMTKKISLFLVLILSVLTLGHIGSSVTLAAEDSGQTVILHKVLFGFGEMPVEEIENTGEIIDSLSDLNPLPDVEFEVYEVTDAYDNLRMDLTLEEAYAELTERGPADSPKFASGITNANGEIRFNLPSSLSEHRVFLFHESARPDGVRERSPDFIVSTPLVNADNELREVTHIYPKNESLEEIDFEKEIDSEDVSFDIGESIPYVIRTKVPVYPSDFDRFIIKDTADDVLIFHPDSLSVQIGETIVENIYTFNPNDNGFELVFDLEALEDFSNEDILITYEMHLSEEAIPDTDYFNQGELDYGHVPTIDSTIVRTGGYRFVKVDRVAEDVKLEGARFILRNNENEYLVINSGRYIWQADIDGATEFISQEDGSIEVVGLKYGQYYLEEIAAPEGYVLSETPIPFRVSYKSYLPGAVMRIINEAKPRLPITGGEEPPAKPQLPITGGEEPPEKPRLPITGEASNIILGVLGIMLIGTAGVILYNQFTNRRKDQ